jgi:hypothetical protein
LLGVTKLRIAQINTTIGVIKHNIRGLDPQVNGSCGSDPKEESKQGQAAVAVHRTEVINEKKKLNKIVTTFMDAITKQIDSMSDNYKSKMNRYEKSISMLYTSQNMIHENCQEFTEV